jgi:6-phosphogluconolactonase
MVAHLKTKMHVSSGIGAMSLHAAGLFSSLAKEAIASKGSFKVALSGGSTPLKLYALLAAEPYRSDIEWPRVELFFGDERCVPPEHKDSNFKHVNEALLSHVPAKAHRIRGELPPKEAALRYEEDIRKAFGGKEGPPVFDLVLLGVGADGHTASLFPGTDALGETEKLAKAVYVEKFESWRVTLTLPVLNAAKNVFFLASGGSKADVVRSVLRGKGNYPAGMVKPASGEVLWLLDIAIAEKL